MYDTAGYTHRESEGPKGMVFPFFSPLPLPLSLLLFALPVLIPTAATISFLSFPFLSIYLSGQNAVHPSTGTKNRKQNRPGYVRRAVQGDG